MKSKLIVLGIVLSFLTVTGLAGMGMAETDKGPAEIMIKPTAKKPKKPPVVFPHAKHQEKLECKTCHHGMDKEGKQVPYKEGMKSEKCASCHNADKLAGKTVDVGWKKPLKLDTLKGAGHGRCLKCHKEAAKKDKKMKKLKKCSNCHKKQKK